MAFEMVRCLPTLLGVERRRTTELVGQLICHTRPQIGAHGTITFSVYRDYGAFIDVTVPLTAAQFSAESNTTKGFGNRTARLRVTTRSGTPVITAWKLWGSSIWHKPPE